MKKNWFGYNHTGITRNLIGFHIHSKEPILCKSRWHHKKLTGFQIQSKEPILCNPKSIDSTTNEIEDSSYVTWQEETFHSRNDT